MCAAVPNEARIEVATCVSDKSGVSIVECDTCERVLTKKDSDRCAPRSVVNSASITPQDAAQFI